jgi:hypothetical protein
MVSYRRQAKPRDPSISISTICDVCSSRGQNLRKQSYVMSTCHPQICPQEKWVLDGPEPFRVAGRSKSFCLSCGSFWIHVSPNTRKVKEASLRISPLSLIIYALQWNSRTWPLLARNDTFSFIFLFPSYCGLSPK